MNCLGIVLVGLEFVEFEMGCLKLENLEEFDG